MQVAGQDVPVVKKDTHEFDKSKRINIPQGTQRIVPDLKTSAPNTRSCMEIKHDRLDHKVCSDDYNAASGIEFEFDKDATAVLTCECIDDSFEYSKAQGCVPIESVSANVNSDIIKKHAQEKNKTYETVLQEYEDSKAKVDQLKEQLDRAIKVMENKEAAKMKASAESISANERIKLINLKEKNKSLQNTIIISVITIVAIGVLIGFFNRNLLLKLVKKQK